MADWNRLYLSEVYLQILAGEEKPPLAIVLRNLPFLLRAMIFAPSRIRALVERVLKNSYFDSNGHHIGRAQMLLGLLYKAKKKRVIAVQHLTEAKQIFSQFGQTPILARVETALAELVMWNRSSPHNGKIAARGSRTALNAHEGGIGKDIFARRQNEPNLPIRWHLRWRFYRANTADIMQRTLDSRD